MGDSSEPSGSLNWVTFVETKTITVCPRNPALYLDPILHQWKHRYLLRLNCSEFKGNLYSDARGCASSAVNDWHIACRQQNILFILHNFIVLAYASIGTEQPFISAVDALARYDSLFRVHLKKTCNINTFSVKVFYFWTLSIFCISINYNVDDGQKPKTTFTYYNARVSLNMHWRTY